MQPQAKSAAGSPIDQTSGQKHSSLLPFIINSGKKTFLFSTICNYLCFRLDLSEDLWVAGEFLFISWVYTGRGHLCFLLVVKNAVWWNKQKPQNEQKKKKRAKISTNNRALYFYIVFLHCIFALYFYIIFYIYNIMYIYIIYIFNMYIIYNIN